jgi:hypothetical protein
MSGALYLLPQYAFMARRSVKKAQGQLYLYIYLNLFVDAHDFHFAIYPAGVRIHIFWA